MTTLSISVTTKEEKRTHVEVEGLPTLDVIRLVEKSLGLYVTATPTSQPSFDPAKFDWNKITCTVPAGPSVVTSGPTTGSFANVKSNFDTLI